jgi:ketosteroid isomerase-like protein
MDESQKIRELLDREQIREAFNRYAFGVDSSDAEAVLSVFDDPCTLITQQPGKPPRGGPRSSGFSTRQSITT